MKKMNTLFLSIVVVGLLLSVSSFAGIASEEKGTLDNTIRFSYVQSNIKPQSLAKNPKSVEPVSDISAAHSLLIPSGADIQITSAEGFDMQPAVANDNAGNLLLGYLGDPTGSGDYTIWFTASPDSGVTWQDNAVAYQIQGVEKPSIDYWGEGTRFFGTMLPSPFDYDGSALYILECMDPNDFDNGYNMVYWTWNNVGEGYFNFQSISLACDNAVEDYAWGGVSMVGDHGSGLMSIPMFSYQATEDGTAWIYSFSDIEEGGLYQHCQVTATDIDPVTHESYSLWNFMNDTTGVYDIYFYKFDFATWDEYQGYPIHPGIAEGVISSANDDQYVDVSAYNDNIIIVSQNNGEITCYYSFDGLGNMSSSVVANSDATEQFPKVIHSGEHEAICLFVKDGNLFSTRTEDGGATWETAIQVNDEDGTVLEESATADICKLGIVWTDDRMGNYDIFFDTHGIAMPLVNVESIAGGFGISAKIVNLGTADAVDVPWTITLDGGFVLLGKETQGTIDTLPTGASVTIKSGLILGIGKVDITVTAAQSQKMVSGTVLLPLVLGVS